MRTAVLCVCLVIPGTAVATPIPLLVAGTITSITDPSGSLAASSLAVGNAFSMSFTLDPSAAADNFPGSFLGSYSYPAVLATGTLGIYNFTRTGLSAEVRDQAALDQLLFASQGPSVSNVPGVTLNSFDLSFFGGPTLLSTDQLGPAISVALGTPGFPNDVFVVRFGSGPTQAEVRANVTQFSDASAALPEPTTIGLLAAGLGTLIVRRRRSFRHRLPLIDER